VAERLRVREIDDDEGRRLVRIVRRDSGSVVTWRRAQMVLLSAQGMEAAAIRSPSRTVEVLLVGVDNHVASFIRSGSNQRLGRRPNLHHRSIALGEQDRPCQFLRSLCHR